MTPKTWLLLKSALKLLRAILLAYAVVLVLAYVFQRRLQYLPSRAPVPLPSGERWNGLEEMRTTTADGVLLHGWFWPGTRPVTLLVFHGNGGNRSHRLEWLDDLRSLRVGFCIVDYRGYGGSEGSPTEKGLYLDADAALGWLEARNAGKVVYLGESLGTAVALELASRRPPGAVILQSAFTSATDVGQAAYPFLPVRLLLKDRYDSLARIPRVSCPLLFLHGDQDSIVPIRFGRRLHDAAPGPKEWREVLGADHNDLPWVGGRAYLETIDDFLRRRVEVGS